MSSRRTVGEDNILAMLERDSARRTGTRASNLRLAWYGAAAAFAGILVGGVAWLAYDNHKTAGQLQAGHDALVAMPPVVANEGALPPPAASALPPAAAEAPRAAVIVDESAPAPRTAGSALPPMVMLPRHEAGPQAAPEPAPSHAAAQPASRVAASSAVPPLVMLSRQDSAAARPAAQPPRAVKQSAGATPAKPRTVQAARSKDDKKADKKVEKAQRTAARSARPAPQRSASKAAVDAPRQRKVAPAAPQVDGDVALISAIIAQSERHRGEREAAAACGGAKCPQKPAQP